MVKLAERVAGSLLRNIGYLAPVGRRVPVVRRVVSKMAVGLIAASTPPRPRPYSMASDHTSWLGVTERRYTGRHLPPVDTPVTVPSEAEVTALYRRPRRPDGGDHEVKSTDTSVLFMFFAQWFTDSFLRTDRDDPRQNNSTQEIDLCQIYGVTEDSTKKLRLGRDGLLKSQLIDGAEYPEYLFDPERAPGHTPVVKPEFKELHDESFLVGTLLAGAPEEQKDRFFAVGLEHGNSTIGATALNVLFLREHNRIARLLKDAHPEWRGPGGPDAAARLDDRVFDTTRMIMTVLLLKLVVEEYIVHITPGDFPLQMVPFLAEGKRWNHSNWIAIEFNLLYRWHSLVPSEARLEPDKADPTALVNNNAFILSHGIEALIAQASRERAGRIGLMNTPHSLVDRDRRRPEAPSVQERTVSMMRNARLASFNDYREHFKLPRLTNFEQLTADPVVRGRLEELYDGDIDKLEWYVGISAEDYSEKEMMGELMTRMVAYDAFTQVLTNPLLDRNIYTEAALSREGLAIIAATTCLQDIVARNAASPHEAYASFRC